MARTCSTSLVPIPNASAPKAPCVLVWLSPQTIVKPGKRQPQLGTDHVDDALAPALDVVKRNRRTRRQLARIASTCRRDSGSRISS